jgi:putative ABC transport system permease protein
MNTFIRDLRHALRGLVARPTHAIVVVMTLALVIGAATAVLAVLSATLVRPLPFPHGERLVELFLMPPGERDWESRNPLSLGTFLRFRQHLKQPEQVEGLWSRERTLGGEAEPEVAIVGAVSPGLFALFGGSAERGRTFTEEEDHANAKLVVLSHAIWWRRFGGDPSILGKTVLIDREPYEVIGIMPPGFATGFTATDLWTPLNATEADVASGNGSGNTVVETFARLRPGLTIGQLQAELVPVMQAAIAENPNFLSGWSALAVSLRDAQFRLQRPGLLALAGGVAALLLIACANLANLMLAQIVRRRPQLALRLALGGGRVALVRLQLCEALLLATAGGVAGIVLAQWVLPILLALDPSLAGVFGKIGVDWRSQVGAAVATAVVALISGLVPLLREFHGNLLRAIAGGVGRAFGSRRDRRMRASLVGSECALSVVLLACASLFLSAFDRTARINPGFDPHSVLAAQLRLSATAYPTVEARADLIARVLERVRALPGLTSAGATLNPFRPGLFFETRVHIEDKPTPDGQPHVVQFRRASPGYFETMRIPLLRGRDFAVSDRFDQPWVVIVSRQFADRYWPGEDPIGRRIRRGTNPHWAAVIGVVGDVRDVGFSHPPAPTVYVPFSQNNVAVTPVSLVVRTPGHALGLAGALRAAVLSVDPQQPIDSVTTVEQFLSDSLGPQRFRSTLLLLLSGIGLILAGLGVYGVTSRAVAERTRELGLRLALGATPASLARLVVWQGMRSALAGLAVGVALAAAAATALFKLLPGLEYAEAWATAPAVLVLAAIALLAAVIPARRALSLAPAVALRTE